MTATPFQAAEPRQSPSRSSSGHKGLAARRSISGKNDTTTAAIRHRRLERRKIIIRPVYHLVPSSSDSSPLLLLLFWATVVTVIFCFVAVTETEAFRPSTSNNHFSIISGTALPSPSSSSALYAGKNKKKKKSNDNTVTVNRIAYRNYEILDTLEAGISLKGTEVKSVRAGKMNMRDGYVRPSKNGRSCVLHNV